MLKSLEVRRGIAGHIWEPETPQFILYAWKNKEGMCRIGVESCEKSFKGCRDEQEWSIP